MMLLNKSSRYNSLKLLAMLPIIGVSLALNAETVTDVVYKNDPPQKQVPVKKGKKNSTIKLGGNQTIKVVEQEKTQAAEQLQSYTAELQEAEPNVAVLILNTKQKGEEPLLIVDGKISTIDQVRALPRDSVARLATMREKAAMKSYGEKGKYGALIITTKKHQEELDNEPKQPDVYDVVEGMPQFPGGEAALMQYLSQNIRYPKEAMEAKTQGRVIVQFVIEKDGSISGAHVVKSVNPQLDAEALRVVNAMPNWTPGTQNGQTVRVKYAVPISFRLKGDENPNAVGTFTPNAEGSFIPTDLKSLSAEEVIRRLPGAEIDKDGNVTIYGKPVKKILVDGKDVIKEGSLKDPIKAKLDETGNMLITTKSKK